MLESIFSTSDTKNLNQKWAAFRVHMTLLTLNTFIIYCNNATLNGSELISFTKHQKLKWFTDDKLEKHEWFENVSFPTVWIGWRLEQRISFAFVFTHCEQTSGRFYQYDNTTTPNRYGQAKVNDK